MRIPNFDHLLGPDLTTYDPYDLWKTKLGQWLKRMYYQKGLVAAPLVAPFFLLDLYAPRLVRAFIAPQEFPVVRAMAAMAALNFHDLDPDPRYLELAQASADWLIDNPSPGYHGACWGINFPWMAKDGFAPPTTPYITNTPYCVEALLRCFDATQKTRYYDAAVSSLGYLEQDLAVLLDQPDQLALSYGPGPEDRIVINANSYAMMLYALLASRIPAQQQPLQHKARRLFNFVASAQQEDGSWLYYSDSQRSGNFIDCFHSCFILKNLMKFGKLTGTDVSSIVDRGLDHVSGNFIDPRSNLAQRFTLSANPSLAKFDLYDQAELLNVLLQRGRLDAAERLFEAVMKYFYLPEVGSFGYQIDRFGLLNKMTYLRWAVMPMVLALSEYSKIRVTAAER